MKQSSKFRQKLMKWHDTENRRVLPWKEEKNVYRIWLSEIILQQTRAEQGLKYYERFIKTYPTITHLAKAPLEEVYKLWEGLGYYNRCRNLHSTAQHIVFELKGKFPVTYESILQLKGVGPYTAAAIASFAFGLPYAVLDGNVFRVLSRFFGIDTAIDSTAGKKIFQELANECLDVNNPAVYNQAIMDFGATVCKPDAADCKNCPLQNGCAAFNLGLVNALPIKGKKIKVRKRWLHFYVLESSGAFAVQKRTGKDVWGHLYQFPNKEHNNEKQWKEKINNGFEEWLSEQKIKQAYRVVAETKPVKQQLSHQLIFGKALLVQLAGKKADVPGWEWKTVKELQQLPFPKLLNDFLKAGILELFAGKRTTVKQKT